jgi:peroxiredoxin
MPRPRPVGGSERPHHAGVSPAAVRVQTAFPETAMGSFEDLDWWKAEHDVEWGQRLPTYPGCGCMTPPDDIPPPASFTVPIPRSSAPAPPPGPRTRRLAGILLPLAPIFLALAAAFIARQVRRPPPAVPAGAMVGTIAPDFSLRDAHKGDKDAPVRLSLLVHKSPVLLVFHMGYGCKRCLLYLGALADLHKDFQEAHVQIAAVSSWDLDSTREAVRGYGDFPYPLLSDPGDVVADAYRLYDDNGVALYGLFLVDSRQRIVFAQRTETPLMNLEEVLQVARKLSAD